jgi:hypothetical protein
VCGGWQPSAEESSDGEKAEIEGEKLLVRKLDVGLQQALKSYRSTS